MLLVSGGVLGQAKVDDDEHAEKENREDEDKLDQRLTGLLHGEAPRRGRERTPAAEGYAVVRGGVGRGLHEGCEAGWCVARWGEGSGRCAAESWCGWRGPKP